MSTRVGSRLNPGDTLGSNEYLAGVQLQRPDKSTILPGGNRVDKRRINKTVGSYTRQGSQARPGGQPVPQND